MGVGNAVEGVEDDVWWVWVRGYVCISLSSVFFSYGSFAFCSSFLGLSFSLSADALSLSKGEEDIRAVHLKRMGLLKRHSQHHHNQQRKPTAELRFTNPNPHCHPHQNTPPPRPAKQWTTADTISGTATFRLPPTTTKDLHATLLLRGTITTQTNESAPGGSLQPAWRTETMKFLSVGREIPLRPPPLPPSRARENQDEVEVPFAFPLEECTRLSTLPSAGLPPSLDSRAKGGKVLAGKRDSKVGYEVGYTLTAALQNFSCGRASVLASTTERLSILPVGQPEPPSYGSLDVAGEFFTAQASPSKGKLPGLGKRGGTGRQIDLVAQEPAPLVFPAGGPDGLEGEREREPATKIEMLVKLSPSRSSSDLFQNLPTQAHVLTTLTSTTHISPNGPTIHQQQQSTPEPKRIRDPDAQTRISRSPAQECALAIPGWEIFHPDGEEGFAIARLVFLYRHRRGSSGKGERELCPSFATPVLERRYGLEVKVEFTGEGQGGGQSAVLTLPLRVGYEFRERMGSEQGDHGSDVIEEDERLARKLSVESQRESGSVFEIPNHRAVAAAA